jgi:hypothetical protein
MLSNFRILFKNIWAHIKVLNLVVLILYFAVLGAFAILPGTQILKVSRL